MLSGIFQHCSLPVLLAASLLAGSAQRPQQDADELCARYASVPLPAEAANVRTPNGPPACASYRSYKGIGRPVDYAAARACAWQERLAQQADLGQNGKEPTAWVVGGSLILADLYANGAGVERNVPLAMRFACEFDKRAVPYAQQRLQEPAAAGKPFELCDDASTTFTGNFCMEYQGEIRYDRRHRSEVALEAGMAATQRAAFRRLLKARDRYISTHDSELDQSGTIHTMRNMGSEEILASLFQAELHQFERKQFPRLSAGRRAAIDADLQREYQVTLGALNARAPADTYEGAVAVTAEGVTKVQHTWLPFRDAWTDFARARYPHAAGAIRALITQDRVRLLKTIR